MTSLKSCLKCVSINFIKKNGTNTKSYFKFLTKTTTNIISYEYLWLVFEIFFISRIWKFSLTETLSNLKIDVNTTFFGHHHPPSN